MMNRVWTMLKESFREFSEDEAMSRAAALAFYTALGLAPTILLVLAVTAFLGEGAKEAMIQQVGSTVGSESAEGINMIVRSAEETPTSGALSAVVGIITVIFSASGIFAQFQTTLNHIWNVKPNPNAGLWDWLRARLLSVGMLFSVLFLMLVSLVVSAAITLILPGTGMLWNLVNLAISVVIFVVLFALIYKYLPDAEIAWRDVWVGAALTAVLFAVGKYFIGLYIGNSALASSYGAAGSLVALLVWVYYSAVIVLFGAEVTQVYAKHFGSGIRPAKYAEPEDRREAASQPAPARRAG
jgi:membrane protein